MILFWRPLLCFHRKILCHNHATFSEEKPTFTLLQERLDNDGSPSISITFPDGHTDNLILSHFYDEENRPEGKKMP